MYGTDHLFLSLQMCYEVETFHSDLSWQLELIAEAIVR